MNAVLTETPMNLAASRTAMPLARHSPPPLLKKPFFVVEPRQGGVAVVALKVAAAWDAQAVSSIRSALVFTRRDSTACTSTSSCRSVRKDTCPSRALNASALVATSPMMSLFYKSTTDWKKGAARPFCLGKAQWLSQFRMAWAIRAPDSWW